jgi:hypothetical protein
MVLVRATITDGGHLSVEWRRSAMGARPILRDRMGEWWMHCDAHLSGVV